MLFRNLDNQLPTNAAQHSRGAKTSVSTLSIEPPMLKLQSDIAPNKMVNVLFQKECIRMSSKTNWDVDQYKTEHESDEHWELRRSFMLAHKDKFPEDRLVCLAQVFTNIEFLGCRYPAETMRLIASLSVGVADRYREKQKGRLQRTFVQASDAAGAKAKGLKRPLQEEGPSKPAPPQPQKILAPDFDSKSVVTIDARQQNHFVSTSQGDSSKMAEVTYGPIVCPAPQTQDVQSSFCASGSSQFGSSRYGGVKTYHIDQASTARSPQTALPVIGGPFGNLVLVERPTETLNALQILRDSTKMCSVPLRWEYDQHVSPEVPCKLYVNEVLLASSLGKTRKQASRAAAAIGLQKLKETCYTIKMKLRFWSDTTIDKSLGMTCNSGTESADVSVPVLGDSIGSRLLRLMGWSGGGLGKDAQGIEEPVSIKEHVNRAGLGLSQPKSVGADDRQFREKVQRLIRDYANGDSQYDLVFSPEFTTEERKSMHAIATRFQLKTRSYGRNKNRHLVISKKKDVWQMLEQLLTSGGSTERYDLIKPTGPASH